MNLIIGSKRMPNFLNNCHNIDQIIKNHNTSEISVAFCINPYKTYHRIVARIQQFHKTLRDITF